ncbi:unnamed protein product [Cunninghamella echinulata]
MTTTTRVFFVESSAHWEAIQRERAQFHNSSTSLIQPDKRITTTKPKGYKPIERASLEKRNTLLIGKEGSRRRQRWNNSHLKDNPLAVLHAEDLKLPGYEQSYRPSLWKNNEFNIETIIDNNQEINFNGENDDNNDDDDGRFTITKRMRHDIKRHHIPEGYVQLYENEILDFISRQNDKNNDGNDDHTLTWEVNDNYHRWIVHILCRYYNLSSNSK